MRNSEKKYFLAANSCTGFVSYFNSAYDPKDGWQAFIIKGGPGTGKSTFMKKVAEIGKERGYVAELCPCSSDPDSLDAVIFPKRKCIIMDGTSPHTVDPVYPGAVDNILNFARFWDADKIKVNKDNILKLTDKNKSLHKAAALYLAAAGPLLQDNYNISLKAADTHKAREYGVKLCSRYFKKQGKGFKEDIRFLTGISPKGIIGYSDTVLSYCSEPVIIRDEYGSISNLIMTEIRDRAEEKGYKIISFKNAFLPHIYDHIVIPELNIAFARESAGFIINSNARRIHSTRFMAKEKLKIKRLKYNTKTANIILNSAVNTLKEAKKVHDDLEECYVSAMDFDALMNFAEDFANKLF